MAPRTSVRNHEAENAEKKDETAQLFERYTNTFRIDKNVKTISLMRESAKFWGLNLKNLRLVDFHTKTAKTRNSQLISDALNDREAKFIIYDTTTPVEGLLSRESENSKQESLSSERGGREREQVL